MSKSGFSISDLQQGAKLLAPSEAKGSGSSFSSTAVDNDAIKSLEKLYSKYNGDLDAIFDELRADPSKAKKPHNRPADATEFANKYLQGFYSIIQDDQADAKSSRK